jgi:16S rRNA (cytosine967-C5)-methyltransferase
VVPVAGSRSRSVALSALVDYESRDAYLGVLLSSRLDGSGLDRRDRALVTELVRGTVRMKLALDWALQPFSSRPLDTLDPEVLWALRLGAYQVMHMSIPDYAAVDMAANSVAEVAGRHAVGYVNAVMRAFAGGRADFAPPDREKDPAGYLSIVHSHPKWIVDMWIDELGLDKAESLCAADNIPPLLSLRTNLLATTRKSLAASLEGKGFTVEEGALTPECLLVKGGEPATSTEEFRSGLFSVQDQGSQMVARLAEPASSMRVIDLCAAPGGKANHFAELMGDQGSVLALDINAARLAMAAETATRLGITTLQTLVADAIDARGAVVGVFDRVLLDAPCTGTGTLARKPDARWRRQPSDVDSLASLQRDLLAGAAGLVAPGGRLIYSTCAISRRENADQVDRFLGEHSDMFEPLDIGFGEQPEAGYVQLFPDSDRCDGIFVAAMRRKP